MLEASLAATAIGLLAWDAFRRYLQSRTDTHKTALDAKEMTQDLRDDMGEAMTAVQGDLVTLADRLETIETERMVV